MLSEKSDKAGPFRKITLKSKYTRMQMRRLNDRSLYVIPLIDYEAI